MRSSGNLGLAGRAGRWSAAHRKTAIWGWIAFAVAAIALGGAPGTKTLTDNAIAEALVVTPGAVEKHVPTSSRSSTSRPATTTAASSPCWRSCAPPTAPSSAPAG
jgi:RND superfamily putative drug exporter